MPLVYTRVSLVCQSYVLVCHTYVIHMYSYVIHMSLVCTRMSSVCHSYSSVCHSYVLVCHSYVTRMWFYHEPVWKSLVLFYHSEMYVKQRLHFITWLKWMQCTNIFKRSQRLTHNYLYKFVEMILRVPIQCKIAEISNTFNYLKPWK